MSTRDEIEAAIEIVTAHRDKRRVSPADVLLPAMRLLADVAISERQQRARDQQPPTREMFERLPNSFWVAGVVISEHPSLHWEDGKPFPVVAGKFVETQLDTIAKLRAACLLLGIETEGIL